MAEQSSSTEEGRSTRLWSTQDPPPEFQGLLFGAAILIGFPALTLTVLDRPGSPATTGAVAVIVVSLLLSIWLVHRGRSMLSMTTMSVILALAAIALILAFVLAQDPITVMATSVPFGFGVAWMHPRWAPAAAGLGAIAVAAVVASLVHDSSVAPRDVVMMGVYFGAAVMGFAGSSLGWQMQQRLDQHHADQHELSLARERLRFATDLHDVQGHTLLAIKMKAELARRSLDRDPGRVLAELQDIEDLAAQAGDQTRELAQGYRGLTLAAELANLDQLLTAAGIQVRIDRGEQAPAAEQEELFATLVREATTNILRHADASRVRIELTSTSVVVRNDGGVGELEHDGPGGSGLLGLQRRFERAGGHVTWQQERDHFTVTGTLEEPS
ncbi:hypothetical protein BH708_04500 [Brachybacterium sp. P6-10-X1]|uniref:sensor histidine kinase n=1 Tax=Brachybacterium sp. P6-10-X1 TaxID=1903186 RepID=UPI0009719E9D|nr:histidine kinase [Brachybacterium sp. P6-10-X1]APX32111.1 hypothetical protein BH708_04500 [Brachybacterium sp. P6-10-X1]